MNQHTLTAVVAPALCLSLFHTEASGIIRRHDVNAQLYLDYGAETQFHSVGEVGFRTQSGGFAGASAVLIDQHWVLTAAHRIAQNPEINWEFRNNEVIHGVDEIIYHPGYDGHPNGLSGQDLALLRLSEPITNVDPAMIAQSSLNFGDQVALVGYGGIGDGLGNDWTFTTERWAANNVWDRGAANSEFYTTDFDDPTSGSALPLEGTTTNGDAGGGMFRFENGRWQLVGIASHNIDINSNGMFGDYRDRAKHTRLDTYLPWIQSTIPAPSSGLLIGFASLGITRRRR